LSSYITSITEIIGNSPLLRLDKIKEHFSYDGNIYAKLEHLSPGFSKKDRVALHMINMAEKRGTLKPGQTVLEMTSGNTGIGVAIVCAAKGYKFLCVMSAGNSEERAKMIEAFGGEVVLIEQAPGGIKGQPTGKDLELVEAAAIKLVEETGAFFLNQFVNPDNIAAQSIAAEEMWEQSDGKIQVFADYAGTGGTFTGYGRALKKRNPSVKCYIVEPYGSAYYKKEMLKDVCHTIQGGGYGKEIAAVDESLIDGIEVVTSEDAIKMTRLLAKLEGVFAGFSSGANLAAAINLLNNAEKGKNIGITINDCGLKYMSTDLF